MMQRIESSWSVNTRTVKTWKYISTSKGSDYLYKYTSKLQYSSVHFITVYRTGIWEETLRKNYKLEPCKTQTPSLDGCAFSGWNAYFSELAKNKAVPSIHRQIDFIWIARRHARAETVVSCMNALDKAEVGRTKGNFLVC